MKKVLLFTFGLCSLFLITGCGANENEEENYSVYEWHSYDSTFKHTEDFIAKYDDNGNLKYLESITVWDKEKNRSCDALNKTTSTYPDLKYEGVGFKCEMLDNGTKLSYYMTDKSIEDGYLSEEDGHYNFSLEYIYPKLKDEEMAKESVQELIDMSKENNLEFNDQNYAVIDGVKTGW